MTEPNPYAAPTAEPEARPRRPARLVLAGRVARLGGAILDTLAVSLPIVIVVLSVGVTPSRDRAELLQELERLQTAFAATGALVLAVVVCNLILLARNGQTIGKWLVRTKIVRPDGARAGLFRLVLLRSVALWVLWWGLEALATGSWWAESGARGEGVGNLVFLIDVLFIFGPRRQCLHDHLADTIVVVA